MSIDQNEPNSWQGRMLHRQERGTDQALRYVVAPAHYQAIRNVVTQTISKVEMLDIGAGSCSLLQDIIQGNPLLSPETETNLREIRDHLKQAVCIEKEEELLQASQLKESASIAHILHTCSENESLPMMTQSCDLAVSRNFLMHLSVTELEQHAAEIYRILRPGGHYVFAITNPAYEIKKVGRPLAEDEAYLYPCDKGQYGFAQHYKSTETIEGILTQHLELKNVTPCMPVSDVLRATHPHYYDPSCPIALIYTYKKN